MTPPLEVFRLRGGIGLREKRDGTLLKGFMKRPSALLCALFLAGALVGASSAQARTEDKNPQAKPGALTRDLNARLGAAAAEDGPIYRNNALRFPEFLLSALPGAEFYPAFFENYAPDATFLIEESNGFSLIDPPRVYFEGDSFTQFDWHLDGFGIASALDTGSPGIIPPLFAVSGYRLEGESPSSRRRGFSFLSAAPVRTGSRLRFSAAGSEIGSFIPWAPLLVEPHATKYDRDDYLHSPRRSLLTGLGLDYAFTRRGRTTDLTFSISVADARRQFNDFGTKNRTFTEPGRLAAVGLNYAKRFGGGSLGLTAVINDLRRDRALAELGRFPGETQDETRQSAFAGLRLNLSRLSFGVSYMRETERRRPAEMNFPKDFADNDGEGLWPFERWGDFSADVVRIDADVPILASEEGRATSLDLFADARISFLRGTEQAFDHNVLTYARLPELVLLWTPGEAERSRNDLAVAGARFEHRFGDRVAFLAKVLIQNSEVRFAQGGNRVRALALGFDAGVRLFKDPEITIAYEQMPYELRENVNVFLERNAPAGRIHRWTDPDGDGAYQPGEEGELVGTTGGPFHEVDAGLRAPLRKRVLLTMTMPLSKTFDLSIKGLYKRIDRNLSVRYKDDYGFTEDVGGTPFFFTDTPVREFVLENAASSKKPFYAQILLQISSRPNGRWFFNMSLLAHMGMGRTVFGNGAGANDIGLLGESLADPNAAINGFGRVDGDRAYLAKINFGFVLFKDLTLGADLKYRDGTPFAFFDSFVRNGQRVIVTRTIKGENEKGIKGGPRKDYLSDVSLKLAYAFTLFGLPASADATLFNLLDLGSELSEYVYASRRFANELQLPRSFRFGLTFAF